MTKVRKPFPRCRLCRTKRNAVAALLVLCLLLVPVCAAFCEADPWAALRPHVGRELTGVPLLGNPDPSKPMRLQMTEVYCPPLGVLRLSPRTGQDLSVQDIYGRAVYFTLSDASFAQSTAYLVPETFTIGAEQQFHVLIAAGDDALTFEYYDHLANPRTQVLRLARTENTVIDAALTPGQRYIVFYDPDGTLRLVTSIQ